MQFAFRQIAVLPLPDSLARDVVQPCQFGLRERRVPNFVADQVSGAGLAVQRLGHWIVRERQGWNSVCKTFLALKNGQLRKGI